ncbi:kinase-like protein [Meredithblackwellia eburnea MCA 4105]
MTIPTRISKSSTQPTLNAAPTETSSGRSSSTGSIRTVSEEQLRGDEEMAAYVRRQQAKKLAAGVSSDTIRKMFEFPDPTDPLPPLDPHAVSLYSRYLSEYEKEEIQEYEKIYFVGPNCDKKPATKENPTNNYGFDDERGDYLLVTHDHIRFRYEVIDVLGKGSFGQVLQCRDHKTGEMVAIKIIRNKKRFHHQALVEIKVLENLVKWDPEEKHYVIRMVDSFTFRGHLCIVTELLSINLYELVKANSFAGFSTTLIRRFTMQILGSLTLLRHQRVVHCDLKPENILLKHPAKSAIKVIDFGSSCFENEKVYTYIQSRFYRSPEVILGMNYHMAIDMWSLGCIIAEMYTGYPIFPGENEQEQLACIMEVMGLPEKYLIDRSSRKRLFFDSTGAPRPVVNSKGRRRRPGTKTLAQVLKTDDELFIDFIAKCLTWDPDRRLKPEPAMRHPWIVAGRSRAASPVTTTSSRITRSSTSAVSSASSSLSSSLSSSNISSPRRKVGSTTSSTMSTPAHHHLLSSSGPATAPAQTRQRTASTSTAVPRLTSKGSLGLPAGSSRYSVKG